jgi:hypothetical protein
MSEPCWLCRGLGGIAVHDRWSQQAGTPLWVAHAPRSATHPTYPCPACEATAWIDHAARARFDWYPLTGLVRVNLNQAPDVIDAASTAVHFVVAQVVEAEAFVIPPGKARSAENARRVVIDYRVLEDMRRHHPQGHYWTEYPGEDNYPRLEIEFNDAARRLVRSWMTTQTQLAGAGH